MTLWNRIRAIFSGGKWAEQEAMLPTINEALDAIEHSLGPDEPDWEERERVRSIQAATDACGGGSIPPPSDLPLLPEDISVLSPQLVAEMIRQDAELGRALRG